MINDKLIILLFFLQSLPSKSNSPAEDFPSLESASKKMSANFIKAEDKLIKPAPVQSQWTNTSVRVSFRNNLTWFSYSLTENFRAMKRIFKMSSG